MEEQQYDPGLSRSMVAELEKFLSDHWDDPSSGYPVLRPRRPSKDGPGRSAAATVPDEEEEVLAAV